MNPKVDVSARRKSASHATLFTLAVAGAAVVALIAAVVTASWADGVCGVDQGFFACHPAARIVVGTVPTTIFLIGALAAFVLTYRVWRTGGEWRIWHAAGWALFVTMAVYIGIASAYLAAD